MTEPKIERKCSLSIKLASEPPKQLVGSSLVLHAATLRFLVRQFEERGIPDDAEATFWSAESVFISWDSKHD